MRGRGGVVVLARATRTPRTTGHPEIRRPGVEVNGKSLVVGTNFNWPGPQRVVKLIGERLSLALLEVIRVGNDSKFVYVRAGIESSRALVSYEVYHILTMLARNKKYHQHLTNYWNKGAYLRVVVDWETAAA